MLLERLTSTILVLQRDTKVEGGHKNGGEEQLRGKTGRSMSSPIGNKGYACIALCTYQHSSPSSMVRSITCNQLRSVHCTSG